MQRFLRVQAVAAYVAFALVLGYVLVDQARDGGLQKGHRGWCSAQVLAIIEHATPANGFVGYTMEYAHDGEPREFWYFDRYPVFFSVAMHAALNTFDLSPSTKIYVAHQAMNVFYIVTLGFAVALLVELCIPPGIAVAAVALAGSGRLLVFYRDMVHFDQAAMAGFMALLWAIARWYRTRDNRFVYIVTALAVMSGRGYASFAVLGVWWLVEAVRALAANARTAPKAIALSTQTRACLLSIAIAASCLGYNIVVEAHKRDVPIASVGIIKSAFKRLTLNAEFNEEKKKDLAWGPFTVRIAERAVDNLQPYFVDRFIDVKNERTVGYVALMMALVIATLIATRRPELRAPFIIAALAGLAWVFPMRGLTAFHDFTNMFLLSMTVVLMAGVASLFPERVQLLPALLACAVLALSTHARNDELREQQSKGERDSLDLERIRAKLRPEDVITTKPNVRNLIQGVPYALGFYLPDHAVKIEGKGPVLVTNKAERAGYVNQTPENKRLFLLRAK